MTKKIKKSVSILLALIMLCGVLAVAPVAVSATTYTVGSAEYSFDSGNLRLIVQVCLVVLPHVQALI